MLKHLSLSTSSVILSGISQGGVRGRGGGDGEKQSEEVKSVNLPNTFDSYSSYGILILWNVGEWKGLQRYTGTFQMMWKGMENNYMIAELKSEITKYRYPCFCHFKTQWVEHSSYLSLSLHGI